MIVDLCSKTVSFKLYGLTFFHQFPLHCGSLENTLNLNNDHLPSQQFYQFSWYFRLNNFSNNFNSDCQNSITNILVKNSVNLGIQFYEYLIYVIEYIIFWSYHEKGQNTKVFTLYKKQ